MTKETEALIVNAADHPQCSSGELHTAQFIQSCLEYTTKTNMKEVIFYADINAIKEIIEMGNEGALERTVKELNPRLLKE